MIDLTNSESCFVTSIEAVKQDTEDGSLPEGYLLQPVLADMLRRITALELGRGLNPAPAVYNPTPSRWVTRKVVSEDERDRMVDMYVRRRMLMRDIAGILDVSTQTVSNQLRSAGVKEPRHHKHWKHYAG